MAAVASAADAAGIAVDEGLPTLHKALDVEEADREVGRVTAAGIPPGAALALRDLRVLAHKVGRRCVIAYDFQVDGAGDETEVRVVGKIRARKRASRGYEQLRTIWTAGFGAGSPDGVSVPEPIGVVHAFDMWLQRRISGVMFTGLLANRSAIDLAPRVVDAIHKLHTAGIKATVRHSIVDELAVLDRCFADASARLPDLTSGLRQLARVCERVAAMLPDPSWCASHRDFYSDQLIVAADGRLFLLDFDLFCEADPGLDIGNFLGHVTEFALRRLGDPAALVVLERALLGRFTDVAGSAAAQAARVYGALTIARHVYLSTTFEERRSTTGALLRLARQRVVECASEGGHA